jgi:hypothetical protein
MSTAVKITRMDQTPAELRAIAAKSRETAQARRLLAIAMGLEGASRLDTARQAGMDRQTLRDWGSRQPQHGCGRVNPTGADAARVLAQNATTAWH